MKKVLVVVGPTAIGKSSLGIKLAKRFNGEIISGDSIQVYKGLDIGSGKIQDKEMEGVIHHGLDILTSKDEYNVYQFQKNARAYIDKISDNNQLPMIVGGTGLYIKACIYDYEFNEQVSNDTSKYDNNTNEELYEMLKQRDPSSLDNIHVNNRQRLIRALVVADSGILKSEIIANQAHVPLYDALIIGLTSDRAIVHDRINKRVDMMFEEGLVNEVENLVKSGVDFNDQSMQGIGYREFKDYFNNEMSLDEVKEKIKTNTRRFAKRQYTWFNNQTPIKWFDISDEASVFKEVELWMNNYKE